MHLIAPVPQTAQDQDGHQADRHGRPPGQDPPEPFDLALLPGPQHDADLVVELADLAVARLALRADGHAPVVEHAPQLVLEARRLLRDALREDVVRVLQVRELGARLGRGGLARVEDLGAEFGAGGAEEVGFLGGWAGRVSFEFWVLFGGREGVLEERVVYQREGGRFTFSTSDFEIRPSFATSRFNASSPLTAFIIVTL